FMQHYTHELSGHVAELNRQVGAMRDVALQGGKSLEAFIQKFVDSADPDFRAQGQLMHQMLHRWHQLSDGLTSLHHAALWERPYLFFKYLDSGVLHDTWRTFAPGIPLTIEGACYAFAGLLIGTALFKLIRSLMRALFSRLKPIQKPV
ncbi:MAG: DUF2937 family protein, partial [Parachlamydia sp.]|nr:DUF2937 family protein [Parachlamydia sp.]